MTDRAQPEPGFGGGEHSQRITDDESEPIEVRTGAEQPWEPEDVAVAEGHDPTPANVERAREELAEEGPALIERIVP